MKTMFKTCKNDTDLGLGCLRMRQGAPIAFVADPSLPSERFACALRAGGFQVLVANSLAGVRAMLAVREVALVAARLDPTSHQALAFARDVSPRVPLLGLFDCPEALTSFEAAAVPLADVIFAPFSDSELTVRIRAALARQRTTRLPPAPFGALAFSGWTLDAEQKSLTDPAGRDIHLTPAEFSLLEALARQPNRMLSRDKLLDAVAGREVAPFDRTIDNLVCRLRRKMEGDRASPRLIVTVPGSGYRLDAKPDEGEPRAPLIRQSLTARQAIVVMPFSAGDTVSEMLASSLTEDLVAGLAPGPDMQVVAGSLATCRAVRQFGPNAVSREFGARYMVSGTVRREGSALRISIQLTDATTGMHLRTERASIEHVVPACSHAAIEHMAYALRRQIRMAEGVRAELAGEVDAAQVIARGRAILLRSEAPESRRLACRIFERALSLDHASVDAMAALGATLIRTVTARWSSEPVADQRRAEGLLRQALRVSPDHFDANFGMGLLLRWQGRWEEAIELLQVSSEIDRNDPNAVTHLGVANLYAARPEKALPHIERAAAIGANTSVSYTCWALGYCHQYLGHFDESLEWLLKARARNRLFPWVRFSLASVLGQMGELDEARRELEVARSLAAPAARGDYATLTAYRSHPQFQHPEFLARAAPTIFAGLAKAGVVDA